MWHGAADRIRRTACALCGLACLLVAMPASADDDDGTWTFVLENDFFYDIDQHYSGGLRYVQVPGADVPPPRLALRLAERLPGFPASGSVRHGYAVGQSMFTPADLDARNPSPLDRPYAGWLYGAIGIGVQNDRRLDLFGLTLGVVGPAALAEDMQLLTHHMRSVTDPQGWHTQLHNEPGFIVTRQRTWLGLAAFDAGGYQIDVSPHAGVALGNVFTYGNVGATIRFGRSLPTDFGPPRVQPGLPGTGEFAPAAGFRAYLFAGVEGRQVARNIFLDGNSFRDSRRVDREPQVADFQAGFVFYWRALRVSYTRVLRTREFTTQESPDRFGSLSISAKY